MKTLDVNTYKSPIRANGPNQLRNRVNALGERVFLVINRVMIPAASGIPRYYEFLLNIFKGYGIVSCLLCQHLLRYAGSQA